MCENYNSVSSQVLQSEPGCESDFRTVDNKFAFSPGQLNKLFNPTSLNAFYALGGLRGLEHGLQTDLQSGLPVDEPVLSRYVTFDEAKKVALSPIIKSRRSSAVDIQDPSRSLPNYPTPTPFTDRARIFGRNELPEGKKKTVLRLLWDAYNEKIIILLTIAAVVSLSLGIYEAASGTSQVDWIEGVAVCVAIVIVVAVTAGNDWQKQRQFAKLNKRKLDRDVIVIRSRTTIRVHITEILVGDVVHLEPGDTAAADGIVITNHAIKCDESMATGESDHVDKVSGYDVREGIKSSTASWELDPFIISGSSILEGIGTYLVTSVGRHSTYGRIMSSLRTESEPTPLQVKLARLASWIGWFGLGSALLLFFVLFLRFLAQLSNSTAPSTVKGQQFMDILIVAVTVIVVAIPEGLPLAVTLALAFATGRMLKENNLVRVLRACETMGNASVICSDKTGTLTQNNMEVVVGFFSTHESFGRLPSETASHAALGTGSVELQRLAVPFKELLVHSIALNTTAFEEQHGTRKEFVGNKTDAALLQLARHNLGMDSLMELQAKAQLEHIYPFDSARKAMAVVYRLRPTGYRILVKGAPELLLESSSQMVLGKSVNQTELILEPIHEDDRQGISQTIATYAQASLRTIAAAYRDFPVWPPEEAKHPPDTQPGFDEVCRDLVWIGAFGIHDPLRPGVTQAVQACHSAGIQVKMVTGDNINTALSIARACGIKTPDGIAMEGHELRKLGEDNLDLILPKLQVLARSSPNDKDFLVKQLKRLGEIVAVTGDGTNDGPALKSADVGFSMGISGTEVAREASSIILLDDNFMSIVTAIAWGRSVNDAVAKFLQFQITVNITAVLLTVVTAIYSSSNESVFKAIQLLWLNLIMDTFAALALATDPPTREILDRPPTSRHASLFTVTMWKLILGQSVYKLALCFTLYFAGEAILGLSKDDHDENLELDTIIFNTFVWMQIFNELNCRRLDNRFNIFEGIHRNYWFLVINVLMIGGQILIIFVGGAAFGVTRLKGYQWAICIGCALFCVPWAAVLKLIPDRYVAAFLDWLVAVIRVLLRPVKEVYQVAVGYLAKCARSCFPLSHLAKKRSHPNDEESEGGRLPETGP